MKRNTQWITAILTGTVLVSLLAACGPRGHSPEDRADWAVDKATSKLELNEVQVGKLHKVKEVMLAARQDFRKQRESGRDAINTLLAKPTLDQNLALDLVSQRTNAVNAQAPQVIAAVGDFYDSLDAAQQTKLREFVSERMEKGQRHWH